MPQLFVVATPIGNLEDITFRAIRVLKEVDFVAAEDTRVSKKLFNHYEIDTPLVSFHAQSDAGKINQIVEKILQKGSAALISDAGTPCISDPGYRLISEAVKQGIEIVPIPGPSALTTLLSGSGYPVDKFMFHGFIPHKKGRQTLIKSFQEAESSQVFYESVHRFPRLLDELEEWVGPQRKICVGRELTKMHEEIFRGTVAEAQDYFTSENTRGEFVVLVAPQNF